MLILINVMIDQGNSLSKFGSKFEKKCWYSLGPLSRCMHAAWTCMQSANAFNIDLKSKSAKLFFQVIVKSISFLIGKERQSR